MTSDVEQLDGAIAPPEGMSSPSPAFSWLVELNQTVDDLSEGAARLASIGARWSIQAWDNDRIELVVECTSEEHMVQVGAAIRDLFSDRLVACTDRVFAVHLGGKLAVIPSMDLNSPSDLALAYTPGVGRVSRLIARCPNAVYDYTGKGNTVAIVTDGTAVLGLGDLGPAAALPVMEGKAALFRQLAGINAVPLCLGTTKVEEIVATVIAVAPGFGGINLEDIAAPRCFAVEDQLRECLDIPVFHDDQHGTAIVVLAALWNALRVVGKTLEESRIVISGAGAAGSAVTRILLAAGAVDIVVWVPTGVLHKDNAPVLPAHKALLAAQTNPGGLRGGLREAMAGADAFIGLSGPGVLQPEMVTTMSRDPIVFALANPVPEIEPSALAGLAAVVATGSSDHPNQINNVLAYPGVFRGALDARAGQVTPVMEMAAARALSMLVGPGLSATRILPDALDPTVTPAVAAAVIQAANVSEGQPYARLT